MKQAALQTDRKQFFCKLVILYQSMFLSAALSIGQNIFIYQNMQIGLTTLPPSLLFTTEQVIRTYNGVQKVYFFAEHISTFFNQEFQLRTNSSQFSLFWWTFIQKEILKTRERKCNFFLRFDKQVDKLRMLVTLIINKLRYWSIIHDTLKRLITQ